MAETMESLGSPRRRRESSSKQIDANRAVYIKQVFGHDWWQLRHYDMVLDTGRLGHQRAAEAILAAAPRQP